MAAPFAPNLNHSRAETHLPKPNKMVSAMRKLGKTLKLASNIGSRRSSQQEVRHSTAIDTSAFVMRNMDPPARNRLSRIISEQLSMETMASDATTLQSTILASPISARMGAPLLETSTSSPKSITLISSIESMLDISATSAQPTNGEVGIVHDVIGASVGLSSSDSFSRLFSSDSSKSMLAASSPATSRVELALVQRTVAAARPVNLVIPDALTPHLECTVHDTADSSVEISYQSAPSGPSTADTLVQQSATSGPSTGDTLVFKSTFQELEADVVSSTASAHTISRPTSALSDSPAQSALEALAVDEVLSSESDHVIGRPTSALSESSVLVAEDERSVTPRPAVNWDDPKSWTERFNDSSSSSLSDLAFEDDIQPNPVAEESEPSSPSSSRSPSIESEVVPDACLQVLSPDSHVCCSQQLQSLGKAAAFLMTYVYLPFIPANSNYCDAPVQGFAEPWPVRVLTDIMEEDESDDAAEDSADDSEDGTASSGSCSASARSLFVITEDEELEETFCNKGFEDVESSSDNEQHLVASPSREPFAARVIRKATPFQCITQVGIDWEDMSSIPTIMEEEAEPSENVVRASASHDSLLAADSDMFEYSQYCLPSESSVASELSAVHAASFPPRPVSRWGMREDFVESDEE